MFEHYEQARQRRRARWIYGLGGAVVAIHGLVLVGLTASSWWSIDKLSPPREGVVLAVATPPPAPPPARKASPKTPATSEREVVRKRKTDDTTQPVRITDEVPQPESGDGGPGRPDGIDGGDPDSFCVGPQCDPLAPKLAPVVPPSGDVDDDDTGGDEQIVPQVAIDKRQISGDRQIRPASETKVKMVRAGDMRVVTTVKMCVSARGTVNRLELLSSSGYPAYDRKVLNQIRTWRYRPFEVNGKPVPVCTAVTLIYTMSR
jgi:protein TonB